MQQLSAEDFLDRMQQLILNTAMNSTYKLALIMALTDASLAVAADVLRRGPSPADVPDTNLRRIPLTCVAREFLRIYWQQRLAYPSPIAGVAPAVLRQSFNRRHGVEQRDRIFALIDEALAAARTVFPDARLVTFDQFCRAGDAIAPVLRKLVNDCVALLKKNPLAFIAKDADFLFSLEKNALVLPASHVRLLQRFRPVITELAQSRWVSHIRSIASNGALLGEIPGDDTLRDFLFDPVRGNALSCIHEVLVKVQGPEHCFYCGRRLSSTDVHVDHFLPFTRYSHTRLFNFVLACPSCNTSKSNWLADAHHVEHWVRRNDDLGEDLIEAASDIVPAGGVEVADMALALYSLAGAHAEPLWNHGPHNRAASGEQLTRDPQSFAHDILPLLETNRSNMARLAAELPAASV